MATETENRSFVCLINDAHQVLVSKRDIGTNNGGQLGLPGGHGHEGETAVQTAIRETFEEIGVKLDFNQSYLKVKVGVRTVFFLRMPDPSRYVFNLDADEVECVYWMQAHQLCAHEHLHMSAQLAVPTLMGLGAKNLYEALDSEKANSEWWEQTDTPTY